MEVLCLTLGMSNFRRHSWPVVARSFLRNSLKKFLETPLPILHLRGEGLIIYAGVERVSYLLMGNLTDILADY